MPVVKIDRARMDAAIAAVMAMGEKVKAANLSEDAKKRFQDQVGVAMEIAHKTQEQMQGLGRVRMGEFLSLLKQNLPPDRLEQWKLVEEIGEIERPVIESILKMVLRKAKVKGDDIVVVVDTLSGLSGQQGKIGMGFKELVYTPGITDYYSSKELLGVIAHEVGHYVSGDSERRLAFETSRPKGDKTEYPDNYKQEYQADAFANRIGYGPNLLSALVETGAKEGPKTLGTPKTHPNLYDRIQRLWDDMSEADRKKIPDPTELLTAINGIRSFENLLRSLHMPVDEARKAAAA